MKWIVAADERGGIGKNGGLLVRIPADMKYFREKTLGKTVIMGRATLESFPGGTPLPKRRTIVLSRTLPEGDAYEVCRSIEELMELTASDNTDDLFVIGGGQIYDQLLPYCNEALVTEIRGVCDADTRITLPRDRPDWDKAAESDTIEENGVSYVFTVYRRRQ